MKTPRFPGKKPRLGLKVYLLAQGAGMGVHLVTDLGQVAYGRFMPLPLWALLISSVLASLLITHVIWLTVRK